MPSPLPVVLPDRCRTCTMRCDTFFCDLPHEALEHFEKIQVPYVFDAGETLFREGEAHKGVFMICRGRVKLSTTAPNGKSMIIKIAGSGEILGMPTLLQGKAHELTAEALQTSQVNYIPHAPFVKLLEEFPAATMRAAEHLSRDCNEAYDHIRTIGLSGSVLERVARMIYDYTAEAQPSKDGDTRAKLALTHEEIAQLLGTSRETVSRALSDLKRRGLAEIRGATLVVHDRPQLAKAARAN